MKRLFVLATVVVLLAVLVSSVSANGMAIPIPAYADYTDNVPGGSVSAEEDKASPILFRHGAVTIEGSDGVEPPPPTQPKSGVAAKRAVTVNHVIQQPPTYPDSASEGEDRPTDEVSLNGGSTISIIVSD